MQAERSRTVILISVRRGVHGVIAIAAVLEIAIFVMIEHVMIINMVINEQPQLLIVRVVLLR